MPVQFSQLTSDKSESSQLPYDSAWSGASDWLKGSAAGSE